MLNVKSGEVGVWEPTWSEANGVKYTLELEQKALQDNVVIDAHNKAAKEK